MRNICISRRLATTRREYIFRPLSEFEVIKQKTHTYTHYCKTDTILVQRSESKIDRKNKNDDISIGRFS